VGQIPIRTLNQDTADVLARVERGETVEITNRGRPIARIVPVTADTMAAAERLGVVEIATVDRRHFTVVRPRHIPAFNVVPH